MRFITLLAAALVLTGCQTMSDSPQISVPEYPRLAFIAPPAPVDEDIPEIKDPRKEIWRAGYWSYSNGTFSWVHGEVMPRPAPWAVWKPDQWVKHTYGWGFEPGSWQ